MKTSDVLLVLDNGAAIPCHSQILSMHSAVLCNMFADVAASQRNEKVKVPVADFTEAQCSAVLAYLYNKSACLFYCIGRNRGAAFANQTPEDIDAAVAVARFAHTYDMPHALRHVEAYLTAFMDARFKTGECCALTGKTFDENLLKMAFMADKYGMHELCGHCERAMTMCWQYYQDRPDLVGQLSSSALQRIAKALNTSLLALSIKVSASGLKKKYPDAHEFTAWARYTQPDQALR